MVEGLRDIGSLAYGWRADAADISRFYPGMQPTVCCRRCNCCETMCRTLTLVRVDAST